MGAPEGWGEVGAGYVAAAAVDDDSGCGLGWFSGWGGHGRFGVLESWDFVNRWLFSSFSNEKSLGLFRCGYGSISEVGVRPKRKVVQCVVAPTWSLELEPWR